MANSQPRTKTRANTPMRTHIPPKITDIPYATTQEEDGLTKEGKDAALPTTPQNYQFRPVQTEADRKEPHGTQNLHEKKERKDVPQQVAVDTKTGTKNENVTSHTRSTPRKKANRRQCSPAGKKLVFPDTHSRDEDFAGRVYY